MMFAPCADPGDRISGYRMSVIPVKIKLREGATSVYQSKPFDTPYYLLSSYERKLIKHDGWGTD